MEKNKLAVTALTDLYDDTINLCIRSAEATNLGHLIGFNRPQVNQCLAVLATAYGKYSNM